MSKYIVALLVVVVSILGACNSAPFTEEKFEETELRILVPDYGRQMASRYEYHLSDFIEVFEDRYPDVTVQLEYFPIPPLSESGIKMEQLLEDYQPDIVQLSGFTTQFYADYFLDLFPFVEMDRIDLDDFYPALIEANTVQGSLKAIPARYELITMFYYNKHVFEAANLDYPTEEWTWEEAIELSEMIELAYSLGDDQNPEVIGLHAPLVDQYWQYIEPILLSYGAPIFSREDWRAEGYLDSPETIEAVQWMVDYLTDFEESSSYMNLFLEENRIGMVYTPGSYVHAFTEYEHIGAVNLPSFKGKNPVHTMELYNLGITQEATNAELAWRFIREFLIDKHELSLQLAQEQLISTRKSVSMESGLSEHRFGSVRLDALENAQVDLFDWVTHFYMDIKGNTPRLFSGEAPPAVLREMAGELDQYIEWLSIMEEE